MSTPTYIHQKIVSDLHYQLRSAIDKNQGNCEVLPSPFAVYLNNDEYTYIEPDLSLICDKSKIDNKGCHGSPEMIIEVVSPSSRRLDYIIKLNKYMNANVFEYIIVDPEKEIITVYCKNDNWNAKTYSINDEININTIKNCHIKLDI